MFFYMELTRRLELHPKYLSKSLHEKLKSEFVPRAYFVPNPN